MVSGRAGRWLRRILAIAIALAVVVLLAATWVYTNQVDGLLLRSEHALPTYEMEVLAVTEAEVTLPRGAGEVAGTWGLVWETGYARVGPVVATSETGVVRPLLAVAGDLRPGLLVGIDAYAYESDPSDVDLDYENVIVEGELGNYPAWYTDGTDDTWVILVHDRDGYRREALRVLPALVAGKTCPTQLHSVLDEAVQDEATGRAFSYVLAWLRVSGGNSVLPPWVRLQYPDTGRLIRHSTRP